MPPRAALEYENHEGTRTPRASVTLRPAYWNTRDPFIVKVMRSRAGAGALRLVSTAPRRISAPAALPWGRSASSNPCSIPSARFLYHSVIAAVRLMVTRSPLRLVAPFGITERLPPRRTSVKEYLQCHEVLSLVCGARLHELSSISESNL